MPLARPSLARLALALGSATLATLSAHAGSGERLFARFDITADINPLGLVTGDLDGDGDADAACVGFARGRLMLFLFDATNGVHWEARTVLLGDLEQPRSLALGDLDGDGDLDLVSRGYFSGFRVLLNDGTAHFPNVGAPTAVDQASQVVLADLDQDQDLDLLVPQRSTSGGGSLHLFFNGGSANFGPALGLASPVVFAHSVAVGDVDADGDVDLAVSGEPATLNPPRVWALLRNQAGTFVPGAAQPLGGSGTQVCIADVDGVPGGEVLAVDGTSSVRITPDAGPTTTWTTGSTRTVTGLRVEDLDGDGDRDLLLAGGAPFHQAEIAVVRNAGGGSFGAPEWHAAGSMPESASALDLDLDGDLDLLSCNSGSDTLTVFLNPGQQVYAEPPRAPVPTLTERAASGDLDLDGDLDVVTASNNSLSFQQSALQVHLNDGSGRFTGQLSLTTDAVRALVVRDLNGDLLPDIVAALSNLDAVLILANLGSGQFAAPVTYTFGNRPEGLVAGDLDGDGDVDLATANRLGQTLAFRWNDGTGVYATLTTIATPVGFQPSGLASGDIDQDGDLDLAVYLKGATASVTWYVNQGGGAFVPGTSLPVTTFTTNFAVANLDGVLGDDLVVTSGSTRLVSVFRNQGTGTFTALSPFQPGSLPEEEATSISLADLDRDGRIDLSIGLGSSDTLEVRLGLGTGLFSPGTRYSLGNVTRALLPGDFDRDALPDLVALSFSTNELVTLLQDRPAVGTAFCAGDGTSGPCPCSNSSAPGSGRGCLNSTGSGALLVASGCERVSGDSVRFDASGLPSSASTVFFQGSASSPAAPLGDGLLCLGGSFVRIATRTASAGSVSYPNPGAVTISVRGGAQPGQTLHYQAYYRNAAAFCTPATFNVSSGLSVSWTP
ncbi:MAG: VCBS repeat-containing protein [Planctomycetes bacterium]|nr:VCBS repeat-containing protein [Planctomycetota bacterium]